MARLFVYGTLMRGCANHGRLAGQGFLAPARTAPGWRLYDAGGYPGLVPAPDDTAGVAGELWEVDPGAFPMLDDFEGVPGLYRRGHIELAEPPRTNAFTYIYARPVDGLPLVGSAWRR